MSGGKASTNDSLLSEQGGVVSSSYYQYNEGSKSVTDVLRKAGDIPQILNETINLLPSLEVLKRESQNQCKGQDDKTIKRDYDERIKRRHEIMNFLTEFSTQSKNYMDQTTDLVSITNMTKERLVQQIKFCESISWNNITLDFFLKQIKKLHSESDEIIKYYKTILTRQRDGQIIEEYMKNSINLFSGAEHLSTIFNQLKNLETQIPQQTKRIQAFEQTFRQKHKDQRNAINSLKNQIKRLQMNIDFENQEMELINKSIDQIKDKKTRYNDQDLIDLKIEIDSIKDEIQEIEKDQLVNLKKNINKQHNSERDRLKAEQMKINNELFYLQEQKKLKKKKIIGIFPDNSEFKKKKKELMMKLTQIEKQINDTYQDEQECLKNEKKYLEQQLVKLNDDLRAKLIERKKEVVKLKGNERYVKLKTRKTELLKLQETKQELINNYKTSISDLQIEVDNKQRCADDLEDEEKGKSKTMKEELKKSYDSQKDLMAKKENYERNDSLELVQLIKLVRNLQTVAHYWYLLQTANSYIIDILVRLSSQLGSIISAIEETKHSKEIEKQKKVSQNLEIMMEEFGGRRALIDELERNINCLTDNETSNFKSKFFEQIGNETLDQLNGRLQQAKDLTQLFPEIPIEFLTIIRNQIFIYLNKKLKLNLQAQKEFLDQNYDKKGDGFFARSFSQSALNTTQSIARKDSKIDKKGIIDIQVGNLKNLILQIFDSKDIRYQLMRKDQLQRDKALLSGGDVQGQVESIANIIIIHHQDIFKISPDSELLNLSKDLENLD
ncbi:UNKNOWN [Stylonychia lemnae]|uniref:Uncharacterized protein n=1 Tax=Stylonychia lemnae TaxID=5949 RepID=A0A078ACT8_STYLE|nr:UNKNOWN [Stylonychia lemnae]|eukprot:CDW80009.1 UNKNOWN [Stylonychia lemnae]